MKILSALLLAFLINTASFSQIQKFKNMDQYSHWIMNYFQKPEPENLYYAFEYGINHKELKSTEGKILLTSFFGSLFRNDSTHINEFYEKVKNHHTHNIHSGFVASLWMANTNYSKTILTEYLSSEIGKKYKSDGLENEMPFDINNDPITEPIHLDIIWADFFATGNTDDILRIISALRNDTMNSEAAKWALTSNGVQYKEVYVVIKNQSELVSNKTVKTKLTQILKDINEDL